MINVKKDTDPCQNKLGQILVKDGKVKSSDVEKALSLQRDNPVQCLLFLSQTPVTGARQKE